MVSGDKSLRQMGKIANTVYGEALKFLTCSFVFFMEYNYKCRNFHI